MKKYSIRILIFSLAGFILLLFIGIYYYVMIAENFYEKKAIEESKYFSEKIATTVESGLDKGYEEFQQIVQKLSILTNEEKIEKLKEEYSTVGKVNYAGFGIIDDNRLIVNGETFVYQNAETNQDMPSYVTEKIAIYTFASAFYHHEDDQAKVFYRYENVIAFFQFEPYIRPILEKESYFEKTLHMVITRDGVIHYSSSEIENNLFYSFLRGKWNSEALIEKIKGDIFHGEMNAVKGSLGKDPAFISYQTLEHDEWCKELYMIQIYDSKDVLGSAQSLMDSLVFMLIIVVAIFVLMYVYTYYLINKKNSDVEIARLSLYYNKPYIFHVNRKGKINWINQTVKQNIGICNGQKIMDLFQESFEFSVISKQMAMNVSFITIELEKRFIRIYSLKNISGYFVVGEDVTNIVEDFETKKQLAFYNTITGLPNKNYFLSTVEEMLDDIEQMKQVNSVVVFNVVGFKNINQLFGEKFGDDVLLKIKSIALEELESYQAKLYNDEVDTFIILFKNLEHYNVSEIWVNKLADKFKEPLEIHNNALRMDIRFGIYHIQDLGLTAKMIYDYSLTALKHAKNSMKSKVVIYDESLGNFFVREQIMEKDIVQGIKNQEFMMYLQPQYDNEEEKIVGFEALIRWNHPKYLLESPGHFIELAEKNGLIIELSKFIIDETFRILKSLEKYHIHISLNVSPVQILQAGFVNDLVAVANKHQVNPSDVAIEITETFLMTNKDIVVEKLKLLKKHGFGIHLDDFGTGYSSMLYLKELPIDTIKIDKEFTKYLNTDKYSRAIVSKIVALAKNLDLNIIAEGVEDEKQNAFLKKSGCRIIQGYWIGKAVSVKDAIDLLKEYNLGETKKSTKKKRGGE